MDLFWPIARWQGKHVLGNLPLETVPTADERGVTVGRGTPKVLTVVGDSIGASAGASSSVFAAHAAAEWSRLIDRAVVWQVIWEPRAQVRTVHYGDANKVPKGDGAVVLVVGVHDLLARTPIHAWRDELDQTIALLAKAGRVVVTGVPEVSASSVVAGPLQWSLASRRRSMDEASREVCERRGVAFVELDARPDELVSSSLIPTEQTYRRWAASVAAALA